MKNVFGIIALVVIIIFSSIYFSKDDREKVLESFESEKKASLLFFSEDSFDMNLKSTAFEEVENGTILIGEDWSKKDKSVSIVYMFNDKEDILIPEEELDVVDNVTVKGQRGFYIKINPEEYGAKEPGTYEEIHFSLNGVYYKVGYYQNGEEYVPVGKDFLVEMIDTHMTNL